jgi:hypothetical protein
MSDPIEPPARTDVTPVEPAPAVSPDEALEADLEPQPDGPDRRDDDAGHRD